jgi:hypothetical protein
MELAKSTKLTLAFFSKVATIQKGKFSKRAVLTYIVD